MGKNNILLFGQNAVVGQNGGVMSQEDYEQDSQRTNGQSGMGRSQLNNKALRQSSYISSGVAEFVANRINGAVDDSISLETFEEDFVEAINIAAKGSLAWKRKNAYHLGEVCISSTQDDSFKFMECTLAGTTGEIEPSWGSVGEAVTDGTVRWQVCDQRSTLTKIESGRLVSLGLDGKLPAVDGSNLTNLPIPEYKQGYVGKIEFPTYIVQDNHIKLNGALLLRASYPKLWEFAQNNGLVVTEADWQEIDATTSLQLKSGLFSDGDGSTTFRLPDHRGTYYSVLDEGRGIDVDGINRSVGIVQGDAIRNITGTISKLTPGGRVGATGSGAFSLSGIEDSWQVGSLERMYKYQVNFNASGVVPVGSRNRPVNSGFFATVQYK